MIFLPISNIGFANPLKKIQTSKEEEEEIEAGNEEEKGKPLQ